MSGSWSVCPACGSLVADTTIHASWHDVLASRLAATTPTTGTSWAGDPVPTIPALTEAEELARIIDRAALDALAILASSAHADGEEWRQPTGAHDTYRLGATVTRHGKLWRSRIPFNPFPPGNPDDPQSYRWWADITPTPDPEPGPQAWDGGGVRYLTGTDLTYGGRLYRVRQDHTSQPDWTPPIVPALYLPL